VFDCAGAKLASTPLGRGFQIVLQFHLEYMYNSSGERESRAEEARMSDESLLAPHPRL